VRSTSPDITTSIVDTSASGIRTAGGAATREVAHVEIRSGCVAIQYNTEHEFCVALVVDGAQGGTWECAHLLGTSDLDAFRGYAGQSRSCQPTHTWNTARVPSA